MRVFFSFAVFVFLAFGPIACTDCVSGFSPCPAGEICSDGGSVSSKDGGSARSPNGDDCDADGDCASAICENGICVECRTDLECAPGEICSNGICYEDTCEGAPRCGQGGTCCPDEQECILDNCLAICETLRCGDELTQCCAEEEICYGSSCALPGAPCQSSVDCGPDEICERDLGVCLPVEAIGTCEYHPAQGDFSPQIDCRWVADSLSEKPQRNDVVMAPVVGNLTDDNNDGVANALDRPEIAFISYDYENDGCCNRAGTLRIIESVCEDGQSPLTLASISEPTLDNSGGLALGDLDGDGFMEIVAMTLENNEAQGTVAFRPTSPDGSTWTVFWHNPTYPTWGVHTRGGTQPSLADLDGNGTVEVIVGNVVLNGLTGELIWDGQTSVGAEAGIGNNAFLGPVSIAADLDGDGFQEVIAGNTVYEHTGHERFTFPFTTQNSPCGGQLPCDGYPGVANFDDDPEAEIVLVRQGEIFVLEHDGIEKIRIPIPVDDCPNNESGPPTIADFDGDGRPEIGTAAGDYFVVADLDCVDPLPAFCYGPGVLWVTPNQDCTSRVTASSVFDFEGDGAAEVIYADETTFRILRGSDGFEIFVDETHGSHTRLEMPVVADVDNDGNAEVIIAENGWGGGTPGVEIWSDAFDNWVFTRRIWSQHAYAVSHITEAGAVLGGLPQNWQDPYLNNFRQNVQGEGVFWAPDLFVPQMTASCHFGASLDIQVTVQNQGSRMVASPLSVAVFLAIEGSEEILLDVLQTTINIFPGNFEVLSLAHSFESASFLPMQLRAVADDDGFGNGSHNECDEENNGSLIVVQCATIEG